MYQASIEELLRELDKEHDLLHRKDAPRLLAMLQDLHAGNDYPFHMPGHKRTDQLAEMAPFFSIDITEIDGFDNLHEATGVLRVIALQAAQLYQAKEAFLSVNGSTGGVLAALMSQIPREGKLILDRGCHKSVYHAVSMHQLHPIYMQAEKLPYEIPGAINPQQVARTMENHPEAKVVVITSPTYEGLILDVEGIAQAVHERGGLLIVDAAHGAHLGIAESTPPNPLQLGADLVIVSLHKTMPAMTQTALVLVGSDKVDKKKLARYMKMLQTSSPSYVLMTSIQESIYYARDYGKKALALMKVKSQNLIRTINHTCKHLMMIDGETSFDTPLCWDYGKLVITTRGGELSGLEIYQILREKYGLQLEMSTPTYALAMLSMMDTSEGYERLEKALCEMDKQLDGEECAKNKQEAVNSNIGKADCINDSKYNSGRSFLLPQIVMPLWKAVEQRQQLVRLKDSIGKICASFIGIYPPGIPMLVPGERIDEVRYGQIMRYLQEGFSVQGIEDMPDTKDEQGMDRMQGVEHDQRIESDKMIAVIEE